MDRRSATVGYITILCGVGIAPRPDLQLLVVNALLKVPIFCIFCVVCQNGASACGSII